MRLTRSLLAYLVTVTLTFLFLGCGTGQGETTLRASFITEPNGGQYVQEMESRIELDRQFEDKSGLFQSSPSPDNISVTVEWVAGGEVKETSQVTVTNKEETYRASISTRDSDLYFVGEWFVRIRWNDDDGQHRVRSGSAFCTLPSQANKNERPISYQEKIERMKGY
ncbi:hypothetical protein [Salinibacter sp. 10B]|uniref:hypothetical protein n=1 Tax=Salinibacter sp. 10B TaxID=1923971 RepID=UPI0011AFE302|nr:hypothetical protein [Salinibacter sp. 10B]